MTIKPSVDRLIAGLKDAIVGVAVSVIGFLIAFVVADLSPYPRHGVYWMMIAAGVMVVYVLMTYVLRLGWSRWGAGRNRPP